MGLADEIIKNKKKKESVADQIINGTYTSQTTSSNKNNNTKITQNNDGYFKKSQGNGWQAFGYSALDALGNLTESSLRAFEGISDWGRNRGADIVDFFGADEYAKQLRERSKQDDTADIVKQWNHITAGDISGTKSEEEIGHFKKVEENSIFGEKSDQVFQGIGNSLTSIGVGALSGGTLATPSFVLSAAGNAETEALNNGATVGEARLYGAISGGIEYFTEKAFGGLGKVSEKFGLGKGQFDDQVVKLFTKNMKSSLMKNITTLGIKSVGEGLEEVLAGIGNAWAQNLTYLKEEDFWDLVKDQNLMDSFVSGMLSSAIMQSPSTITSTVQGRDVNTGLTRTQQQYVNEIAQQRMVEAQRRNAKLNGYEKGKIEDRALTDFQKGRLIDGSKLPLRTQQAVNLPGLNAQTGAKVQSSVKGMDLQQSAYYYGFNPNSEFVVTTKTMLDNRGIKSRFDADAFKNIKGNAYWTNNNGVREVVFNPNASEQAILEEIAIHELTHDLMSSKNSKKIINNQKILDYVSTLDGYKESRAKLEKLYSNQTKGMNKKQANALIYEEIVADTLGKNIGSQEYIRRLIDDEPSIAKNIYDWVVNKVANKNGVKNEKAYWNNVKNNFEKAYNMSYEGKGSKNDAKFALSENALNEVSDVIRQTKEEAEKSSVQFVKLKDNTIKELVKYGIKDLPMLERSGHVRENILTETEAKNLGYSTKNKHYHGLGVKTYLEIIDAMDNATGVYQYISEPGRFIVETPIKIKGVKSVVPIMIEQKGRYNNVSIDFNKIRTVFSPDSKNYISNLLKKGTIKEVVTGDNSQQVPLVANNVTQSSDNVKSDQKFSMSEQLENQANEVAKKEIAERQAMIELFEDYLNENDITNPTEQDIYNSLDAYDVYDANESFDQEGQEKYFDTIKKYLKEQNQDTRYSLSDYQEYTNEINATLEKAKNLDEKFYNDLIAQQEEYRERHQLEYNILEETNSRPATNENINSDFFKEHRSEYDEKRGIKTPDGRVTVMHLQKGDNLAKLSFTEGEDIIWIDELYVKNQKQGYGSEIVNSIKKYAEENGKYVQAFKELSTAKGFWDKTLRNNTRYSLTDNKGRTLTKEQQERFKDSKVRDENGNLLTMYHGTYEDFNVFEANEWTKEQSGVTRIKGYFATEKEYSEIYGDNVQEYYLDIKNPLNTTDVDGNEARTLEEWQKFFESKGITGVKFDSSLYGANNKGLSSEKGELYIPFEIVDADEYWVGDGNVTEMIEKAGYDGITWVEGGRTYVPFKANAIKKVNNLNPTNDADIRYSLSEAPTQDNEGRPLTKEQREWNRGNKAVDEDGDLIVMYHGSDNDFTVFDKSKKGTRSGEEWTDTKLGFFFSDNYNYALYFGDAREFYIKMTNPLDFFNLTDVDKNIFKEHFNQLKEYSDNKEWGKFKEYLANNEEAYDILTKNYDSIMCKGYTSEFIVFEPNQIKNVDNLNPTDDADIRYSLSDNQEERISKLQNEYAALDKTRDVTFDERDALRKELNELIRSENYKNANSKFMEMVRSGLSPNEISKTPEYQLMAEEERIRKKLKEYDEDIKVMTEDMTRITEMIENEEQSHRNPEDAVKQAKDFFGTTNDFREAGYLLQDGTLLDFSGRTQGSRTYGRRTLDHREINEVGYDMDEFIELGNIRMKPESSGFELSKPLTKEQKSIIRDYLDTLDDDIMIDITKEGKVLYDSATYKKGTSASKIFNDLDYYFENGSFPKQSKYAEFRYSLSKQNEDWQSFLDKNFEAKGTKTRLGDIKLPGITNTVQEEVQTEVQKSLLPITNELKELNKNLNKVLNPNEISQLTPQDANTTPILPGINRNQVGDGRSNFFDNINNKVNMLNDEQKTAILSSNDVKYYDKVTNKDSLDKAYARLQENGQSESLRWFNKASESADATDVAEGWILLKHYADSGDTNGMVEVAKKLRDMGTKAGQTVQAFNILSRLTPEGMVKYAQSELLEAYDQMVKNKSAKWIEDNRSKFDLQPNEVQFIMDTMREVSTMEDGYDKRFKLAQIQKVLTDKLPPAKGAGIKAWMRISMLFNPKTQVRNVAGNALIAPINAFGDMFASGVDKLVSAKTGVRTTGNTNWKNYAQGMKTGLYQSYNDFKNGVNTRNIEGNRFEVTEGKSFNDNNPIGKALNKVDSLLSFMLDAGDRGFYEASFVNSINNQMVLNNTTEVTQDMIDIATQEALSRTWQDNNEYTKFVMNVRNGLNKMTIGGYGLGDVLIPFAKTPANLTKAIVEYSPAGLIGTINKGIKLNRSLTNGQYSAKTQHEFVQSLGKATAGTMLYILGIALANAGVTTGESDEDKDVSNFMKNTLGVNSYSIKIGDTSFTYDWAQPLAAPLAITANLVQKQKEEASLLENVVSTLDTAGNLLLEQSFMESISTVLNNNEGVATGMQEAILDLPARAIPTFLKQITDLTDGTQRQTFVKDKPLESMWNSVKAKIPGLSYTLDPSVDTLGREIQKYGGKNNLFNVFLNPANVSTENVSESAQEIYRLYKETGETNIMPRVAPYYVNKKGEKIILSTEERTEYQKISGAIIEENIANLLGSTAYQNMTDTNKAEVINDIVNYSYNIAQNQVLGLELADTYKTAYEYAQIGDISDFYEFRNSIDDTDSTTKRTSIKNYLINSDLDDNQIANLYGNYYSSDKTLNAMLGLRIPMKEFIKFDSEDIQGQYNTNTGQTISGSKKNATIEYVNTLNLSKAQRAILVKSAYSSYKNNDNDIIRYVNTLPGTANEKKVLLKSIGFDAYDDDVFNYINSQNLSKDEKIKKLKELGFTVRDGRVYY